MPSTFSTLNRFELMADGEDSNTWGDKTNMTLNLLDDRLDGYEIINISGGADATLTLENGSTDQFRQGIIYLNGTISADINVICPATSWVRFFMNATAGAHNVTIKAVGLPNAYNLVQGYGALLWCDGGFGVRAVVQQAAHFSCPDVAITGGSIDNVILDCGTF